MPTRNTNWDHNSDKPPFCDDCGVLCERGYSMRWRDGKIGAVYCFNCNDARDLAEYNKTRRLSSGFMTTAIIRQYDATKRRNKRRRAARFMPNARGRRRCFRIPRPYEDARRDIQRVEDVVRHFRQTVWPDVHAQVNAERHSKGMRVDVNGLTILAFAMCGRIRIQVEREDSWCAAQGSEESAEYGIGLHGIGATAKDAVQLWRDAIKAFKTGARLVADQKVGIL